MLLLSFLLSLISTKASFKSYESNCGYVYDADIGSSFPLNVCITDYDKDHSFAQYSSREYICTPKGESTEIEVYTYYGTNCTGNHDETRSALGSDNTVYRCGTDGLPTDACYFEYRQYNDVTAEDCDVSWKQLSYTTQYVIVGACVPVSKFKFNRCTADSNTVQYVEFNDDACCDLSYVYTDHDGPDWTNYDDIKPGCDVINGRYIDGDTFKCLIPDDLVADTDIFTDNTDPLCTDDAYSLLPNGVMIAIFGAVMLINIF